MRKQLEEQPPEAGTQEALHVKYRPKVLGDVWGQESLTKSLAKALASPTRGHAYLFTGPSGCGKTTLARIVASTMGVTPENIIEADAATNTGIDAMRAITDTLRYKGFGDSPLKMVILDEVHALSKAAWQSLLKTLEEPPAHVYFALCTTEPGKVPDTVRTRCLEYVVKSLSNDDLFDLLVHVVDREKIDVDDRVLDQVVKVAGGSPRKALTALAVVADARDAKEAAVLLSQPFETEDVIELCRGLVGAKLTWDMVTRVLNDNKDEDPEGLRLVIVNYLNAVLLKSSPKTAPHLLDLLSEFMRPINRSEKMAPLLLAFGNIIFPGN